MKERKLRKWIAGGKISSDEFNDLLQEKVIERVKFWGDVLCVSDWKFYVRVTRIKDLTMDNCLAEVAYLDEASIAYISISRPCDTTTSQSRDIEQELVHELMHVRLRRFCVSVGYRHKKFSDIQEVLMENVVDQVAGGIVGAMRVHDKGMIPMIGGQSE